MSKGFDVEINIDNTVDRNNADIWGSAYAWSADGTYGAEYNYCIENGVNMSAIYFMALNEQGDDYQTDPCLFIHYEVDFSSDLWHQDLEAKMISALEVFA